MEAPNKMKQRRSALARVYHERFKVQVKKQLTPAVFKPWCVVTSAMLMVLLFLVYLVISLFVAHVYLLPEHKLCDNTTTKDVDFLFPTDMTVLCPLITMIYVALFFTSVYCISNDCTRLCTTYLLYIIIILYYSIYSATISSNTNSHINRKSTTIYILLSNFFVITVFCLCQTNNFCIRYTCKYYSKKKLCLYICFIITQIVIVVIIVYTFVLVLILFQPTESDTFPFTWEFLKYCKNANNNYTIFFHSQIAVNTTVHFVLFYLLFKYITLHRRVLQQLEGEKKDYQRVKNTTTRIPLLSDPKELHRADYHSMGVTKLDKHMSRQTIPEMVQEQIKVDTGQHQVNIEELSMSSGANRPIIASPQANVAAPDFTVGKQRDQDVYCNDEEDQGFKSFTPQVKQSAFFSAVEKTAGVPFLDHILLECDSAGREWTNVDHDITLRIPEGAVAEGEKIHFEVGVAMYGPFIFPDNTQPISPILWLCLLEENVELRKPFQVVLPHYLTGLSKERVQYHQVGFAKASHNDYTFVDDQMTFKFQHSDIEPVLASSGYRSYGVLTSKHCCFYCLEANHTPELANDTGYCLTRIESFSTPQRNEVYFSATYFLDTCLRSLEEQFPREHFQVSRYDGFKFKNGTESLQLIVPVEYDQCIVALEPKNGKINPSDVNFWAESFANMQLKHERRMYPPRIKMTVAFRNPDNIDMIKLPITFTGYVGDEKLDMELILPLGSTCLSPTSIFVGSGSQNTEPSSHTIICEPPKLRDVFRKLLPLASQWKTIGVLLDIPKHVLSKIQSDEEGVNDRLHEMLSEWLKQVDPPPTWKDLADAVDVVDQQKAKEIREQCVDLHVT